MKDNENNAAKEKRFVDVDAIEKVIAELPLLTRQRHCEHPAGVEMRISCGC